MSAPNLPSAEVRLRVEELTGFHSGLVRAAGECGVGGKELHALFADRVRATCVGCGLVLSGEEIGLISITPGATPPDGRLDRLRLGYCGRPACESRFYQVVIDPVPGIEPAKVVPRALDLWKNPPPEPEPVIATGPLPWWKVRRNQYALGALAVVLLVWWKLGPTEGPLAIRKEPAKYEAAPQPYRGGSGEALQ
jgi:hypothetical protein